MAKCLSEHVDYSITENIYYSQLSSVAILLQLEPFSLRIVQGKDWVLYPHVLSPCGLPLPPTCLLVTVNEARSYFASTIYCTLGSVGGGARSRTGLDSSSHGSEHEDNCILGCCAV
jgi:hypothetical protein